MSIDEIYEELTFRYSPLADGVMTRVEIDDVQRWCKEAKLNYSVLFDKLAKWLAVGFDSKIYSFEFCDEIINDLWSLQWSHWPEPSKFFWNVYEAFDAGEFNWSGDTSTDPVETYARPAIAHLMHQDDWSKCS